MKAGSKYLQLEAERLGIIPRAEAGSEPRTLAEMLATERAGRLAQPASAQGGVSVRLWCRLCGTERRWLQGRGNAKLFT